MHSKIINPRQHGRFVFHNRGSCSKTVTYLGHEARVQGKAAEFFNETDADILATEVQSMIDGNVKGLRRQHEKYYSLVLSPSSEEVAHIGNRPEKWQDYTRQVMQNYAKNFQYRDGRQLFPADLIWFATVHQERKEKQGADKGKPKDGGHLHIHVIVSAKDKTGTVRLNPRGRKSQFSIRHWQITNGETFQKIFDYKKPTVSQKLVETISPEQVARQQQRIRDRISYLNEYLIGSKLLDTTKVMAIGEEQQYGKGFFFRLHRLTEHYRQGRPVNNPYHLLQTGKDEPIRFPERTLLHLGKGAQSLGQEVSEDDERNRRKKKQRSQTNQPLER